MKNIPDLMVQKISRPKDVDSLPEKPHASVAANEKTKKDMEAAEVALHSAARELKSSNPGAWTVYENALLDIYHLAKELQKSNFFELIATRTDPQFYTMTQIYCHAKLEIVEQILSASQTPIAPPKVVPKKKVNIFLDFFRRCISFSNK